MCERLVAARLDAAVTLFLLLWPSPSAPLRPTSLTAILLVFKEDCPFHSQRLQCDFFSCLETSQLMQAETNLKMKINPRSAARPGRRGAKKKREEGSGARCVSRLFAESPLVHTAAYRSWPQRQLQMRWRRWMKMSQKPCLPTSTRRRRAGLVKLLLFPIFVPCLLRRIIAPA